MHPLEALEMQVSQCRRCDLRDQAHGVVFGEGALDSHIVFCGEGPGAEEDRLLRPFVGAAGHLLDKMLDAMGFSRGKNAYILNVVKCRPPGNRVPLPQELAACRPHLAAQLSILSPRIMVLLGSTAIQSFLGPQARVTRVHGQWTEHQGIWLMPTYHPAALLRNPSWKVDAWSDLKKAIDKYRELVDPEHFSTHYPPKDIR
ncbi:MAG: uracil-DNA glycosylase [Sulfobacillus sp.]